MYSAFLQRTKEAIAALSRHIRTSDRFRTVVSEDLLKCTSNSPCFDPALIRAGEAPDSLEWRVIDHCAAVTRIYAIYEQFVHEMVREHISLLQQRLSFSQLPKSVQTSYRSGISKILEKKDGPKYADLDLSALIGAYNAALNGKAYKLEPKAMLMQDQNLRFSELNRFMSACGIEGVTPWIEQHKALKDFFSTEDRLSASPVSEMAELVKYRNDAAHGSIDISDILNVNGLIEFCDFVAAVCEALADRVQLAGLLALKEHNHARERGKVTESLKGDMVAIGMMSGQFKVGDSVYFYGEYYCLERKIVSLQINDTSYPEVNLDINTELGMMLDAPGKRNSTVIAIEPLVER